MRDFTALIPIETVKAPAKATLPVRVIGIDLGTTNSVVAEIVWDPKQPHTPSVRCLEIEQITETGIYRHMLVPSVVACLEDETWVGEGAKRLRATGKLKRNLNLFYECKNDIGTKRTYHLAPEGYRSPADIGRHVLSFLYHAAEEADSHDISRTVVTVPASFQVAQRQDTLLAADFLNLQPGDLLDEPVAAFLDYLIQYPERLSLQKMDKNTVLVFDFGGGTCDIAVFETKYQGQHRRIAISPLSVSRYHRLGGGDIDAAIVHEVLIPQVIEQHDLDEHFLEYEDRKLYLEPALLSVAESLKIGLCIEIARLKAFQKYDTADKTEVKKILPGKWPCPCPKQKDLALTNPVLTAEAFEDLLAPFLDEELLYLRETEYFLSRSIFAPIHDALTRAGLTQREINYCLLVGGSSLIPQVQEAVKQYFPSAQILTYDDNESCQLAVARGAAWHALFLAIFGKSFCQPVTHDAIYLRIQSGRKEIVPKGVPLPYPGAKKYVEYRDLVVPKTCGVHATPLKVEILAGAEERPLFSKNWEIPVAINPGEPLRLRVSMDANQTLILELSLANHPNAKPFQGTIENPLTNVVNPDANRLKIDELEEELRSNIHDRSTTIEILEQLATLYDELNQTDKAIFYLRRILDIKNAPDSSILNRLGILYGRKNDYARQEKCYLEAYKANPADGIPLFNLSLTLREQKRLSEAKRTIEKAIAVDSEAPYLVLLGVILADLHDNEAARSTLKKAIKMFGPVESLSDWELHWYRTAVRHHLVADSEKVEEIQKEEIRRKKRRSSPTDSPSIGPILPDIAPGLKKR